MFCLLSPFGFFVGIVELLSDDPAKHASDSQQLTLVDLSVAEFATLLASLPEYLEIELHLIRIVNRVVKTLDVVFLQSFDYEPVLNESIVRGPSHRHLFLNKMRTFLIGAFKPHP